MRYHTAWQGVIDFIKRPHLHWFDISTLNPLSTKTIRHDPWGTDPPSAFFCKESIMHSPQSKSNDQRVYRLSQLASTPSRQGLLPVSPASIWRWIKAGTFPKPHKLGQNCTVWDSAEINLWIESQRGGE